MAVKVQKYQKRVSEVTAVASPKPFKMIFESGEHHVEAGDYIVLDDGGDIWSVKPAIFHNRYVLVHPFASVRYEAKPVIVQAAQAEENTTVQTLEGVRFATPGDFIVWGEEGDVWFMSAEKFNAKYELIG